MSFYFDKRNNTVIQLRQEMKEINVRHRDSTTWEKCAEIGKYNHDFSFDHWVKSGEFIAISKEDVDYLLSVWKREKISETDFKMPAKAEPSSSKNETNNIDHPKHYNQGKLEVIDVILDWKLGFCLGNTVKYIGRAGHKDPEKTLEDLKKARWYLDREISELEKKAAT